MKKLFTLLLITVSLTTFSQESNFWDNVRFGGGFGFSFGNNRTTLSISPSAVYDVTQEFSLGASLGYLYNKSGDFNANVFSGSVLTLYRPIDQIEFSGELQQSYVNRSFNSIKDTYSYPSLFLGAAYRTGKVSFGIQYDVLYKDGKSIYANAFTPFIRVLF